MKRILLLFCLLWLACTVCKGQQVIPCPNHYEQRAGSLHIPKTVTVSADSGDFSSLIPGYLQSLRKFSIPALKVEKNGFIRLKWNPRFMHPEEYFLTIDPEKITVEAGNAAGCFYGLQTVLQFLNDAGCESTLSCAVVHDVPRYGWRGVMLDESRHFMGMKEVKSLLDFMALHKLNTFHWHLTDSPGWRIEIKQYPRLTTVGGVGDYSNPGRAAQFYTQEEIREIVQYAAERFIEVIPEIDMPGHATAACKAYPEYSGGGSEQYPDFTFNPGKDETYSFLTNILKEIAALFPSRYIHIGGDEVHFGNENWKRLPEIGTLMQENNLNDLVAVEHYFLHRMSDSIRLLDKTVMGWDEVVTASLPPLNTRVMWWRHDKPDYLSQALQAGYEVILCPRLPLYFDFDQFDTHQSGRKWGGAFAPIEDVYRFPEKGDAHGVSILSPLIKGIQANIWTERIDSAERMQYMTYPRLSALAEAAWTNEEVKDFAGFDHRMKGMMNTYQRFGITYFDYKNPDRTPEIPGATMK